MALTSVHSITVRRGQISVDVDRYTFRFSVHIGPNRRIELGEVYSEVHGRRNPKIDRHDQVAKQAGRDAREQVMVVLNAWLREHPTEGVSNLDNQDLWLAPGIALLTKEQRAQNLAAIDQLTSSLADQLRMPGPCASRRPLS